MQGAQKNLQQHEGLSSRLSLFPNGFEVQNRFELQKSKRNDEDVADQFPVTKQGTGQALASLGRAFEASEYGQSCLHSAACKREGIKLDRLSDAVGHL